MRLLIAAVLALATVGCGRVDSQQFAQPLEQAASRMPSWVDRDASGKRLWALERKFYVERQHLPAWIDGDGPTPQLDALLAALRDAERHGLEPAAYAYDELNAIRAKADATWFGASFEPHQIPELDLRLTYAFLTHAADLLGWRSSLRAANVEWVPARKKVDVLEHLRAALANNSVRETLDGLAPAHPQYKGLQAALARARTQSPEGVDPDKIRVNLERWRWAPRDLGDRYILINIPSYEMHVVEDDRRVLSMRVIVGAPDTPTPLFSDVMTYVVFSPTWNIPESIQREELLPRLVEDPEYLPRNNIEIVSTSGELVDPFAVDWNDPTVIEALRFRQKPGPDNALGLVKFIFPNHFSVYLHDTPADSLFKRERRTFSHGCIRVEDPVALSAYVLQDDPQWTTERIRAAMDLQQERTVTLKRRIPVHIGYWTAWVQDDGSVAYLDDPYGVDQAHMPTRSHRKAD